MIVISTINPAPATSIVSASIGVQLKVPEQTVASFVVVNVIIVSEIPAVITPAQSPVKKGRKVVVYYIILLI